MAIGAAIGAGLAAYQGAKKAGLFGGTEHGPGSASRQKNLASFTTKLGSLPFEEVQLRYDKYLERTKNCTNASDPASCQQIAGIYAQTLSAMTPGSDSLPLSSPEIVPAAPSGVIDLNSPPPGAAGGAGAPDLATLGLLAALGYALWRM